MRRQPHHDIVSFGRFTVDRKTGELLRDGMRVKLQAKPFEVLLALLETPGEVVSRDALYARLWPGVSADYRRGLDTAVKKLRQALEESVEAQEFVETLPRRGYRLNVESIEIASSQQLPEDAPAPSSSESLRIPPLSHPASSEGRRLYLQGYHCSNRRTPASLKIALSYLQRAHEIEPKNADYLAAIAHTIIVTAVDGAARPIEMLALSKKAAVKALQCDGSQALAQTVLAAIRGVFEYDLTAGGDDLERIIAANSDNQWCYVPYAFILTALGLHRESRAAMEKAHLLDPVSPVINVRRGFLVYLSRDFNEALSLSRDAVARDPDFGLAHFYLGQVLLAKANYTQAVHHLKTADHIMVQSCAIRATLGLAYAAAGDHKKAKETERALDQISPPKYADPYHTALLKWALGSHDEAVALIKRAYTEHSPWFSLAAVDPKLDGIRDDPRVRPVLRRLKRSFAASAPDHQ